MMTLWLRALLHRLHPFAQAANALRAPITLGVRLFLADVFFKAGLTKLADWDVTLALFADEYHVPLLPPEAAAWAGTGGELVLPVLLALGLVVLTVVVVGYAMHWLIPAMPLAVAFTLGAIVSPRMIHSETITPMISGTCTNQAPR